MRKIIIIVFLALVVIPLNANIVIESNFEKLNIVSRAMVFEDSKSLFLIDDIIHLKKFKSCKGKNFRFGYSKSTLWLKWDIKNLTDSEKFIEISQTATDFIKMYIVDGEKIIYNSKDVGDSYPFDNREVENRKFVFKVIESQKNLTYIFKIKSTSYLTFPVIISSQKVFQKDDYFEYALIWAFFGMMIIMTIYNFLIYTTIRDKEYLFYVLFNLAYAVHVFSCKGLGFQLFWREYPVFNNLSSTTFLIFAALMQLQFAKYFLKLKERVYYLYIMVNVVFLVILFVFVSVTIFKSSRFSSIGFLMFLISSVVLAVYAFYDAMKGSRSSLYFFIAWISAIGFTVIGGLFTNGIMVISFISKWSIQEGALLQTIFLSFGLADRINSMRKNLIDLNVNLEEKVKDRTVDLNQAMGELESVNNDLIKTNKNLKQVLDISKKDMNMAVNVQKNFLPVLVPDNSIWDIDFIYRPMAGVSGDFYDFYIIDEKFSGIGIFDVSGHGIASALITTIARSIIFRHLKDGVNIDLNEVIEKANNSLQDEIGSVDNYITGLILRFIDEDTIEFVNAAHHAPVLKGFSLTEEISEKFDDKDDSITGFFLGMSEINFPYKSNIFKVKRGESVLLYTDCLIEEKNSFGEEFGIERLLASFGNAPNHSVKEIIQYIMNDFNSFVEDSEDLSDDLTIILLKKK